MVAPIDPNLAVSGVSSTAASSGIDAAKLASYISTYNSYIGTLVNTIQPNLQAPQDAFPLFMSLFQNALGIYSDLNTMTPEQLAQYPGLTDALKVLDKDFKVAINQCLAQLNATGTINFNQLPLSQQLVLLPDGSYDFDKTHGNLYDQLVAVSTMLSSTP